MNLGDWRDVSLILLALEAMLIGLIYGVIFYYLWKGARIAHGWLSAIGLPLGRRYTRLIKRYTQHYSYKVAQPFARADMLLSRTKSILHALGASRHPEQSP